MTTVAADGECSDRGKMGVKGNLLVEGSGYPLAVCVAGANINDHLLLATTLDAVVVERPKQHHSERMCEPITEKPQNLCLDKGFDNAPTREVVKERGYIAHIKRIGEEKTDEQGEKTHPARPDKTSFVMGCGANNRLALTVARHLEPLGKETAKLSGEPETCVCLALVPKSVVSKLTHFEIDSILF